MVKQTPQENRKVDIFWKKYEIQSAILYIDFICLENLTLPFKNPCMIDLKMGSVAYNPLKSQKQMLKILNSTSGVNGFRISGMEVYRSIDKKILFRNKYWGRSIKSEDMC